MIANKIRPKIQKVINKFPTRALVFREGKNEFNEPSAPIELFEITGFYHEGNNQISSFLTEKGEFKRKKQKFLMVLYDEKSKLIEEGDYICFIDDSASDVVIVENAKKYFIKDKGNQNRLNIYFDMLLEE